MIGPALKAGAIMGVSYVIGGNLGTAAWRAVSPHASQDSMTGAAWAGRLTTFLVLSVVLARVGAV
jgi:hypothetical protein